MPISFDSEALIAWFQVHKRDLPWRHSPTPYQVWISEVMLQQTQVAVVIPYYLRWMERFPSLEKLAEADLNEVIKLWEGLGYYSRARNLHAGAQKICTDFKGILPEEEASLSQIKGLGEYTIGAIRSFAFHQKAAAVDGNVIRVLARYFMMTDDIAKSSTKKKIADTALHILPQEEPWVFNEALIELGATLCTKAPRCSECPLRKGCGGHINGIAERLPYKSKKTTLTLLYRAVAVIISSDRILVKKGQEGKIMHDLYEFPYFETTAKGLSNATLCKTIGQQLDLKVEIKQSLPNVVHSFTRYKAELAPVLLHCTTPKETPPYIWKSLSELKEIAFSSGHRRILNNIIESQ